SATLYLIGTEQSFDLPHVRPHGGFRGIPRVALPLFPIHEADAPLVPPSPMSVNPFVTQIVNATSQANWFGYVKDLSGENVVVIGDDFTTIRTRYSDAMFPTTASNALASEYILEKGASWGYTGVREPYAASDSGCGAQS